MRRLLRRMFVPALMAAICFASVTSAPAQTSSSGNLNFTGEKVAIAVGAVAVVAVVVVLVVVHKQSGKQTVTGCVSSGSGGTVLTRDADKRTYVLGGDTSTLHEGHRMKLHVKKMSPGAGKGAQIWFVTKSADAGLCGP